MFSKSTIFKSKIITSSHEGAQSCYTLWYDLISQHMATSPTTAGHGPLRYGGCPLWVRLSMSTRTQGWESEEM